MDDTRPENAQIAEIREMHKRRYLLHKKLQAQTGLVEPEVQPEWVERNHEVVQSKDSQACKRPHKSEKEVFDRIVQLSKHKSQLTKLGRETKACATFDQFYVKLIDFRNMLQSCLLWIPRELKTRDNEDFCEIRATVMRLLTNLPPCTMQYDLRMDKLVVAQVKDFLNEIIHLAEIEDSAVSIDISPDVSRDEEIARELAASDLRSDSQSDLPPVFTPAMVSDAFE